MNKAFQIVLFFVAGVGLHAQNYEQGIRRFIDSTYAANPEATGFLVYVEAPAQHIAWSYAVGYNNRATHEKLLPNQPVLMASNTKPYIAAAILRLAEQGKLQVDEPINKVLSAKTGQVLANAGYNTQAITLKHLLSHTSGIRDYVDDSYFAFIDANKQHTWSRDEQIARAAQMGKPLAAPGGIFHYADVNFVLLTEVIENVTKQPFYKAVRQLLGYKKLGLNETWFAKLEQAPAIAAPRAHQYWDKYKWDTYQLDPSWDLYGGGGMIATGKDMARFFQNLFNRKIIHDNKVLAMMYTDVPPDLEINYYLGIRKIKVAGLTAYNHGGGLGTDVVYIPKLNATVAVAALEASHRHVALDIREEIVKQLSLLR